jgi:polyferredoxin
MGTTTNYSIAGDKTQDLNITQKLGLTLASISLFILLLTWFTGLTLTPSWFYLSILLLGFSAGPVIYAVGTYKGLPAGIKNNGVYFNSLTNRGALGWIGAIILTLFYVCLYWYGDWFGDGTGAKGANEGTVALFDPLSQMIRGKSADKWFLYGTFYTVAIVFLGTKFLFKYRKNRYHFIRTVVVMFSQLGLAYILPFVLEGLNATSGGYYSLNPVNSWPLNSDFLTGYRIDARIAPESQPMGVAYMVWGIILFLIITPFVTYLVGKRWYCSWFCGCGGLAETAGDNFRHLSDKSLKAWKIERWLVHSVMVFVMLMTIAVMYSYFAKSEFKLMMYFPAWVGYSLLFGFLGLAVLLFLFLYFKGKGKSRNFMLVGAVIGMVMILSMLFSYLGNDSQAFGINSNTIKKGYGFFIGAIFSGIVGVGFYPLLGNRVWCRFGCPMAGYMGIIQRFKSRFRITTNGGQCISCGNCSTYCEQGIDVRAYAQKGQNIVRAACVGCGVCTSVCPRGVLKLENGPEEGRVNDNPIIIGHDEHPTLRR